MNRREFVGSVAGAIAGLSAGKKGTATSLGDQSSSDYMTPVPGGRVFHSLAEARAAALKAGDVLLIRDMGTIVPKGICVADIVDGKWGLRRYQLSDGQSGRLLMVNAQVPAQQLQHLPEEFNIRLDLPGWYALWIGVPLLELKPTLVSVFGGVDLALDTDPAFVSAGPERGTRLGKIMGPVNVEVMCYWKCAKLDGRSLRVRIPYGTFLSLPWGMVRASVSCLRLVRLSERQVEAYEGDTVNPRTKRVIIVNDGFSPYWMAGQPWKGIDVRFPQQYRKSDVKMYFLQTPSTGVASWPSKVTDLIGQDVTEQQWKLLRLGDRRAYEYFRWAVKNHQEGFRVAGTLCRKSGVQFHASLRLNLYFKNVWVKGADNKGVGEAIEEYFNGPFWWKHPELRRPGSVHLDYAQPKVREFILAILMELATNYDVDGLSLDFTRWPPIVDPARDPFSLLTEFIVEVRRRLDGVASRKNRKLALSAMVVDGYHARRNGHLMSLKDQKIDLEAWLASRTLDFICVEAWDHSRHLALAKRYHTPYYAIQDQESIRVPGGSRDDPEWRVAGQPAHDPVPGEELESQPPVNATLDPTEYDQAFLPRYRMGIDGACIVNGDLSADFPRRLGHIQEMAERVKTGERWGQKIGPRIEVF